MLNTIRGEDGKPYISLEDMMEEVKNSLNELREKLDSDLDEDDISSDMIESRIEFLNKLYESFKNIQQEYYKSLIGFK